MISATVRSRAPGSHGEVRKALWSGTESNYSKLVLDGCATDIRILETKKCWKTAELDEEHFPILRTAILVISTPDTANKDAKKAN